MIGSSRGSCLRKGGRARPSTEGGGQKGSWKIAEHVAVVIRDDLVARALYEEEEED